MFGESSIKEHMHVLASDGGHIGTVDHVENDSLIKLTRTNSPDGKHHFIPIYWVDSVDETVHLSKPGDEVRQQWKTI